MPDPMDAKARNVNDVIKAILDAAMEGTGPSPEADAAFQVASAILIHSIAQTHSFDAEAMYQLHCEGIRDAMEKHRVTVIETKGKPS